MPEPLSSAPDFHFFGLVSQALADQVVLYVGAGVSVTAGLPTGKDLAKLVHARVESSGVDLTGIATDDLLAIANVAEAQIRTSALQLARCPASFRDRGHVTAPRTVHAWIAREEKTDDR